MARHATQLTPSPPGEGARSAVERIAAFAAAARSVQQELDVQPISALMDLVGRVRPSEVYSRTRPVIQ